MVFEKCLYGCACVRVRVGVCVCVGGGGGGGGVRLALCFFCVMVGLEGCYGMPAVRMLPLAAMQSVARTQNSCSRSLAIPTRRL